MAKTIRKGKKKNQQINNLLYQVDAALTVASRNAEIFEQLVPYGYNKARLEEGKQLVETARTKTETQNRKYSLLQDARLNVEKVLALAKGKYNNDLSLARLVLKNDHSSLAKLNAGGRRKFALGGWIKDARVFYTNAMESENIMEKLSFMSLNRKKLKEGLKLLENLETAIAEKEVCKGDAIDSSKERDEAVQILQEWFGKMKGVIYMRFGTDHPHLISLHLKESKEHGDGEEPAEEPEETTLE